MRKLNPKIRWHVTAEEKNKIRRLTRDRVSQAEIARLMHIGADTISKWQVRMGLPTRIPVPEKKIMQLFRKGLGGYEIARRLGIAVSAVYKIAHKNKFRRPGAGYPVPPAKRAKIIAAIRAGGVYVNGIARCFGVTVQTVARIAHDELGCPEFRPGACKPALSSDCPQNFLPPGISSFAMFAEKIVTRYQHHVVDERLSRADRAEILCESTMQGMQGVPVLRDAAPDEKELFHARLLDAIRVRLAATENATHNSWLN